MIKLNTLCRTLSAVLLLVAAAASVAPRPAAATTIAGPVDLFFNGTEPASDGGLYGLSAQSVNDFFNAGGQSFPGQPTFLPSGQFTAVTPDNLPVGIPGTQGGPDHVANPSTASNDWMITPNNDFDDVWLVFRGHSPNDPRGANNFGPGGYLPQNVGLHIDLGGPDIWRLLTVSDCCSFPDVHYLALFLGTVEDGTTIAQTIDYRVRQALLLDSNTGNFIVPQ